MSDKFSALYTFDGMIKQSIGGEAEEILKENITALEEELCRRTGAEHCVAVPDVTTGLRLAMLAADIRAGSQVLCSGFAQEHVAEAILLAEASPLLVDINPNTYNMDPYLLEYTIGKCIRTKQSVPRVLVIADMFGLPCNYEALEKTCRFHGITMITDASESMGGRMGETPAGCAGRFGVVSLAKEPHQPQSGECGAVLCHNTGDRSLLQNILMKIRGSHLQAVCGDSVHAGVALERLAEHDSKVQAQQKVAREYRSCFSGHLKSQQIPEEYESTFNRFVVSLPESADKRAVLERLGEQGIPCGEFTSPCCEQEEEGNRVLLMNASRACERLIALPINPYLGGRVAAEIAEKVIEEVHGATCTS